MPPSPDCFFKQTFGRILITAVLIVSFKSGTIRETPRASQPYTWPVYSESGLDSLIVWQWASVEECKIPLG